VVEVHQRLQALLEQGEMVAHLAEVVVEVAHLKTVLHLVQEAKVARDSWW
jgi:N-dimethylarginine dimethylaminohydrolase